MYIVKLTCPASKSVRKFFLHESTASRPGAILDSKLMFALCFEVAIAFPFNGMPLLVNEQSITPIFMKMAVEDSMVTFSPASRIVCGTKDISNTPSPGSLYTPNATPLVILLTLIPSALPEVTRPACKSIAVPSSTSESSTSALKIKPS